MKPLKCLCWFVGCIVLLAAVSVSHAVAIGPGELDLSEPEFAGYHITESMTVNFDHWNLPDISVTSAAYGDGSSYLYLYQVINDNSSSVLHRFIIDPFEGLSSTSEMGYITGGEPLGFLAGGIIPTSVDVEESTAGFDFNISPGAKSSVLYVQSKFAPGQISGCVINGGVAYGDVLGPVHTPEPATMALLGMGVLLIRRKNKLFHKNP